MVTVTAVTPHSPADRHGVRAGDILRTINGREVCDVLDYRFFLAANKLTMVFERVGETYICEIPKRTYDDIGLSFATYLMDEKKTCRNKCVFCFIDQMPKGMRETLYFKDDDARLSFLMGNYITLTNLSEHDIARICEMKTSPMHVSVHTTNPELRVRMMGNRFAGNVMEVLARFAAAGIRLHGQIVLCRGLNDGKELVRTMHDLATLYPAMESVSIVPSGLTDHREGLYPLTPFDKASSLAALAAVEQMARACYDAYCSRIFFAADELYLMAERPLPAGDAYEGYPQLENGVGMVTSLREDFAAALAYLAEDYDLSRPRSYSIATGLAAAPILTELAETLMARVPEMRIRVYGIENRFFGKYITVAGLVTGGDLAAQLADKDLGDALILPDVMLRHEKDLFLDDMTPETLARTLGVPVRIAATDADGLLAAIFGADDTQK